MTSQPINTATKAHGSTGRPIMKVPEKACCKSVQTFYEQLLAEHKRVIANYKARMASGYGEEAQARIKALEAEVLDEVRKRGELSRELEDALRSIADLEQILEDNGLGPQYSLDDAEVSEDFG